MFESSLHGLAQGFFSHLSHLIFRTEMKSGAIFASASLSEVALGPTALRNAGNPMMGLK